MHPRPSSLLLVTHVEIRCSDNGAEIDDQTAAGLAQWCKHFDRVTYFGVEYDASNSNASSVSWVKIDDAVFANRCKLIALPRAYRLGKMLKYFRATKIRLATEIRRHDYLCFTLGLIAGDWPSVAAYLSIQQNRSYSAWIDRVEPVVIRDKLAKAAFLKRSCGNAVLPFVDRGIRYFLKKSDVALLQGMDTFDYYKSVPKNPHCTYDTHTHISDQIKAVVLARKIERILSEAPINIVYVGRAAAMKGPDDWIEALKILNSCKIPFRATWIGDGFELSRMREKAIHFNLSSMVHFPGFEGNRETLLERMRAADLMLFCHKTPESPRCLIEALVSGCPLVGYDSAYVRGLIRIAGGAAFAPQDDFVTLAHRVIELHQDRTKFAQLVTAAATSGRAYNEDALYEHRAALMKHARNTTD